MNPIQKQILELLNEFNDQNPGYYLARSYFLDNLKIDDKTLEELEMHRQIIYRYCDEKCTVNSESNPNGAIHNIAGICNRERNVFGMMPHPERVCNASLGNEDGRKVFEHLFQLN